MYMYAHAHLTFLSSLYSQAEVTFVDGNVCTAVGGASVEGSAEEKVREEEEEETDGTPEASGKLAPSDRDPSGTSIGQ